MNIDYPVLPFIAYGRVDRDKGFFITLPFKPISLNEYKKMHFGRVRQLRGQYKSVLDIIGIASFIKTYFDKFDEDGLHLKKPLFDGKIDIEWFITFLNKEEVHDPSNYTQKIMLDAITDIGMIIDDSELFINKDSVQFGLKGYDSITCFMKGKINKQMLLKSVKNTTYETMLKSVGIRDGK